MNTPLELVEASLPEVDGKPQSELEIFYELAHSGDIDPWDVDIVQLTDRYLEALAELDANDLKRLGKALLYAAVLLRFKSDTLSGIPIFPEPEQEFDDAFDDEPYPFDEGDAPIPIDPVERQKQRWHAIANQPTTLDNVLRPRFSARPKRQRKVTLSELIEEIKRFETLETKKEVEGALERREKRGDKSYEKLSTKDIIDLAHDEFIEATVIKLQRLLERLLLHQEAIPLTELEEEGQLDRVSAYIALLFLTAQGQVDLHQDAFYEELHVTHADPLEDSLTAMLDETNQATHQTDTLEMPSEGSS